jgi:hypothetical protein
MINQATLKSLSATFAKFQSEVAAKEVYLKQYAEAEAALTSADTVLRDRLAAIGWDGNSNPENFLAEKADQIIEVVSRLEQLGGSTPAPAPAPMSSVFPAFAPPGAR